MRNCSGILGRGRVHGRQHVGHGWAAAALATGLDLLPAVLAPPGRAHPKKAVG
jgi:hypothetical protein